MSTDSKDSLSNSQLSSFFDNDIYIIEKKTYQENNASKDAPNLILDKKEIVIILKDEKEKSSYGELLKKILTAVQVDMKAILLLNSSETLPDFSETKFKFLISFGVNSKALNLDLKEKINEIKEINNSKFLFTNTLEEIENDIAKKKILWSCLQIFFK